MSRAQVGVVTSGLPGSHFPAWDITLPVGWGESDWGPSISGLAQSLQSVSGGQVEEGSSHLVTLTRDVTSATGSCGETGKCRWPAHSGEREAASLSWPHSCSVGEVVVLLP